METNVPEALKAKAYAEKHFAEGDFTGARKYALKAQMICPQLEGISQTVATFGVYAASEVRINGEIDLYGILRLEPSADKSRVKKQYKKMAVLLHPDKNKSVGADGAFKTAVNVVSNGHAGCRENPVLKPGWSAKKRKVDAAGSGSEEIPSRNSTETRAAYANGNLKPNSKLSTESSVRSHSTAPAFDVRQLLIDKARSDIRKKVEEMRVATEAEKKNKALAEVVIMSAEALKTSESNSTIHQSKLKRTVSCQEQS
ncbi:hypothetical protein Leryth_021604 [Lithospermum erythrorhizon]|nr:hypothetical protein Leryth_021604 [Lithospermum erythrorhizon]